VPGVDAPLRPKNGLAAARCPGAARMEAMAPVSAPVRQSDTDTEESTTTDRPWIVLVWNDPINLMSYVTLVLQKVFGYSLEKATALMLDVHHKGRAVVSNGTREKAEFDVFRLHEHGLWATMQQDD
jgi:ATP-dependent Clp protease adaptor protein ClpS